MHLAFSLCAFLFLSFNALPTWAVGASNLRLHLPEGGTVHLHVPPEWRVDFDTPVYGYPTVSFKPEADVVKRFSILVTPMWHDKKEPTALSPENLRMFMLAAGELLKNRSLEKNIIIRETQGQQGTGYYYTLTDPEPRPGEFQYLTQGIIPVGNLALYFSILTNQDQEVRLTEMLSMLRNTTYENRSWPVDKLSVRVPGRPWKIQLEIPPSFSVLQLPERVSLVRSKGDYLIKAKSIGGDYLAIRTHQRQNGRECDSPTSQILYKQKMEKKIDSLRESKHPNYFLFSAYAGSDQIWLAAFTHDDQCILIDISKPYRRKNAEQEAMDIIDSLTFE